MKKKIHRSLLWNKLQYKLPSILSNTILACLTENHSFCWTWGCIHLTNAEFYLPEGTVIACLKRNERTGIITYAAKLFRRYYFFFTIFQYLKNTVEGNQDPRVERNKNFSRKIATAKKTVIKPKRSEKTVIHHHCDKNNFISCTV